MKKLTAIILVLVTLLTSVCALADKVEIDINEMTPAELLALKDQIEKEYSKSTYVDSDYSSELSADFKKTFEGLFTDAQDFGYPFFGMSVSRARTLYKVSGNCTVRYYDKSKISYDVNSFYYHDEASGEFTLALLMLGNDIAYKDDAALANIARFIDKATMSVIKPYI